MKRTIPVVVLFCMVVMGRPVAAQSSNPADAVETFGQGAINWTTGEVSATGIGAPPAAAANPAQSRAMAVRAAQVVAYRNLLEIVKGVRVDSETVVENFMTKSDVIRTRVDGIVKNARIVRTQYLSDGSVEVLVAMPLAGAMMDAVVPPSFGSRTPMPSMPPPSGRIAPTEPKLPPASPQRPPVVPDRRPEPTRPEPSLKPEQPRSVTPEPVRPAPSAAADQPSVQFKGGKATGIVIDGRGLGLRPALLPKIVDHQGREIYVGQVVTRTNAVEQGVAGYAKDVAAAANNFRVTDNPVVMKGVSAAGTARTDIVLGQADAQALRDLSARADFLQYCRVIIVY